MKKVTKFYKTPAKVNPSPFGKEMLALQVGESILMPWGAGSRPSGPGQVGFAGKIYDMVPTEDGLKVTRAK